MIVFYCPKRDPTNNAWWACSLAKGHAGACVFDRKDKSGKAKVMRDTMKKKTTPKPKRDLRAIVDDLRVAVNNANDKAKTIALKLFEVEEENKQLKGEKKATQLWKDLAKKDAGFDRNVSFDVVWGLALKAYRNGGAGWTVCSETLPPEATGPGHGAGWTAWLECTCGELTDSGIIVFTAAYSHCLGHWQDIDQQNRKVTHYRKLPTLESIK